MSQFKKEVFAVAPFGNCLLSAQKAITNIMLPIVDKPLLQHVDNECFKAGLTEITLVTNTNKNSIHNNFDTSFELEASLDKRVKC